MNKHPKVVAFTRTPEYVHHRAMLNRRDNNIVDALELMRRAVEESPDNSEYRLDLAEMYCEMGCHSQSIKLLLDLLADQNGPAECYYGLALNQLGLNNLAGAARALELYRSREPEGEHAEAVEQLVSELDYYERMERLENRKRSRAARLSDRACEAMKTDAPERACRLFERSLDLWPDQNEMRALYAMALFMLGETGQAHAQAGRAVEGKAPSVRAMCVSAQVFALLGDEKRSSALIRAAIDERPGGYEQRLLIYAMGEMGMHADVAEQARLALQDTPYDRTLMHTRAIALKKCGESDAKLERVWTRILRIDPQDSVAGFFQKTAREGGLNAYTLDYNYQVPREEYAQRVLRLVRTMEGGIESVQKAWREDADMRQLILWAVYAEDARLARTAVTMLALMDDADARSALRQMLYDGALPLSLKLHVTFLLNVQGQSPQALMPSQMSLADGLVPDADALVGQMPVGERALVRYAAEVLECDFGHASLLMPAMVWSVYRQGRGTRMDPLNETEAAAAALAYNCLMLYGDHRGIGEVAGAFGCTPRQMVYYARRIAGCVEKMGELLIHEDL